MTPETQLAQRIKEARNIGRFAVDECGYLMRRAGGANTRTLQRWEAGDSIPNAIHIAIFARVVGASTDWLLDVNPARDPTAALDILPEIPAPSAPRKPQTAPRPKTRPAKPPPTR